MIATLKHFFFTLKAVRLIPFTQTEPFSIISAANFWGNANSNSQLPFFSFLFLQIPVVSTWPCTKCPSRRLFNKRERSIFTNVPATQLFRSVFWSVSSMAVTRWRFPSIASIVRQTPLWLMLWSTLNSAESGDSIQKILLEPFEMISLTTPIVSIIPVNMAAN